ncbi:hypothetical protein Pla8534_19020 [Lignipirellula cremea]|uniref:Uncharacterized protein n=1 Tax=Lignipirellula cremea TaxID=2528010 RepID=A0A518DQK2_9BACT|nr:hypothetical protein Pla8534_19020 [Lignipirellula cremea]
MVSRLNFELRSNSDERSPTTCGDHVTVEEITSNHVKISTVKFETQTDGSIFPVKTDANIAPTKSSKLKPADLVIPSKQNRTLKVNFVDVQQEEWIAYVSEQHFDAAD